MFETSYHSKMFGNSKFLDPILGLILFTKNCCQVLIFSPVNRELQTYMAKMLLVCSERWCIGFLVFAQSVISNCVVHISCTYFLVLINNNVVCVCSFSLFSALCILIVGGFLKIFFGSTSLELVLSIGGAFLFSLFIIYDTQV